MLHATVASGRLQLKTTPQDSAQVLRVESRFEMCRGRDVAKASC